MYYEQLGGKAVVGKPWLVANQLMVAGPSEAAVKELAGELSCLVLGPLLCCKYAQLHVTLTSSVIVCAMWLIFKEFPCLPREGLEDRAVVASGWESLFSVSAASVQRSHPRSEETHRSDCQHIWKHVFM
jgi:hypothetical protein